MEAKKELKRNKATIAGQLGIFSGFTIQMFLLVTVIMLIFFGLVFANIYSFYNSVMKNGQAAKTTCP